MPITIVVEEECYQAHVSQTHGNAQWTVYRIANDNRIVVESQKPRSVSLEDTIGKAADSINASVKTLWYELIHSMPDHDGRYAVFDYVKLQKDGTWTSASSFVFWLPEEASPETKSIYTAGKDTLKTALDIS
ncbi:cofilin-1-A-like [Haliotis rubra]|uniref:cofilin-1-A-like n=1 Tax=Haliotis rubra TaxID=36100 RepID=UPI001EE546D8|nr:cofilin-1-A-like [Haliotis rubra]